MNPIHPSGKISTRVRKNFIIAFSLIFGCLLSWVFEDGVLPDAIGNSPAAAGFRIFFAIPAYLFGLLSSSLLFPPRIGAKNRILTGLSLAAAATTPLFFSSLSLPVRLLSLSVRVFACGIAAPAWGYCLKTCTPPKKRTETCADILIGANLILMAVRGIFPFLAPMTVLWMHGVILLGAGYFVYSLPEQEESEAEKPSAKQELPSKPVIVFIIFIFFLAVNSGFLHGVFLPVCFGTGRLSGVYQVIPYAAVLIILRTCRKSNRPETFYSAIGMILLSCLLFTLTESGAAAGALMTGGYAVFDLFQLSLFGAILEYSRHIFRITGICLAANGFGFFLGERIGNEAGLRELPNAHEAVFILTLVCIVTALLPLVNVFLIQVLKRHIYLYPCTWTDQERHAAATLGSPVFSPLSAREKEVMQLLLEARSNKAIAKTLHISEHTVKTHVKNIFGKYDVAGRMELILSVWKNQTESESDTSRTKPAERTGRFTGSGNRG